MWWPTYASETCLLGLCGLIGTKWAGKVGRALRERRAVVDGVAPDGPFQCLPFCRARHSFEREARRGAREPRRRRRRAGRGQARRVDPAPRFVVLRIREHHQIPRRLQAPLRKGLLAALEVHSCARAPPQRWLGFDCNRQPYAL